MFFVRWVMLLMKSPLALLRDLYGQAWVHPVRVVLEARGSSGDAIVQRVVQTSFVAPPARLLGCRDADDVEREHEGFPREGVIQIQGDGRVAAQRVDRRIDCPTI